MNEITITRPDDWHVHLRDGDVLKTVVPHTAAEFGRAIVMPNLKPPVTTAAQAVAYKARIQAAIPKGINFEPLMTLYLTDNLAPEEIYRAKEEGVVAAKLYPAGATTNSDAGVTNMRHIYKTLEAMQKSGMLLLVHGEVTSQDIDLFDREAVLSIHNLFHCAKIFLNSKLCSSTSRLKRLLSMWRVAQRIRAQRSPRTTCSITAMLFLRAACVPIFTVCRC